mmetsp:Transcript_1267/g.2746  ORF Transcript_1267/g.2746 Transcript_1267/m.2746 type:complete len:618 (+) Transcript_1267:136-1989(+)|eukprot:CAMPEP_0196137206 /NCGR_PEP_ID=MMETSP0910-20130528/5262_1 /TAXON_ID=49265 /ORGANISM="Thalassiosira rotula, Strain GSO102" /LENGTH=617 /DNA_ID=CAMNT_0041397633 /DNA_START=127 /DNA_END=1980 /DNA_ORIENTATION=+
MFHIEEARTGSKEAANAPPPASPSIAASPYWGKPITTTSKASSSSLDDDDASHSEGDGFSPFVGFCFTINYILGTGFLTVPWAFAQGGLVLSTIVILAVGIFSDMSKNYLLETMARAEAMLDHRMHWIKKKKPPVRREVEEGDDDDTKRPMLVYSPVVVRGENSNLLLPREPHDNYNSTTTTATTTSASSGGVGHAKSSCELAELSHPPTITALPGTPNRDGRRLLQRRLRPNATTKQQPSSEYLIKERKFEVNSLCRVYLGKSGLHIYTASICLYVYCTLWAYTCVFASAMSTAFATPFSNSNDANYLIFAIVFASMVVPMSCMEMHEQVTVQVLMTGARFLMLGLMVGTSRICAEDVRREGGGSFVEAPMFELEGIASMAPIMVFAHIYHHSIPGLAHPVADKKKLSGIFRSTAVFSTLAYSFIGLILGSHFGKNIDQSSNLNWKSFTGGTAVYDDDGEVVSIAWWAKAISLYVLCFPALDVISAFPLNAITLGNNMMVSAYGKRIHEVEKNKCIRTQFRLLASVPPILFGILQRQLGKITDYAGTTGFVIGFSFPALLYLRSRMLAERKHFSAVTFYSGYASYKFGAWCLFSFGVAMLLYVVFFLVRDGLSYEE